MQESGIFRTALKLPAAERAAYLDKACGANAALRLEVEGLLRAHDSPGEFMQRPPIADMTTDYRSGPERPWEVPDVPLNELERRAIIAALERRQGNIKETAAALGIDRSTLYDKLKRYEIQR